MRDPCSEKRPPPAPHSASVGGKPASRPTAAAAPKSGKLLYTAHRTVWSYLGEHPAGFGIGWASISLVVLIIACVVTAQAKDAQGADPADVALTVGLFWVLFAAAVLAGTIALIVAFIRAKHYTLSIYDDRIVERSGVFFTQEKGSVMTPIVGVSVYQTLWGKMWGYGDLHIDKVGNARWDVSTTGIKHPYELKAVLDKLVARTDYGNVGMFISQ